VGDVHDRINQENYFTFSVVSGLLPIGGVEGRGSWV